LVFALTGTKLGVGGEAKADPDGEGQQVKGVRQENSLSWDQKQGKLKEIHKTFEPRINAVLTSEQQEKYKRLEQEAREKHEEKMKAGSVDAPH